MLAVLLTTVAVAALAAVIYVGRERLGVAGAGMAALRATGLGALILLLVNPTRTAQVSSPPTILLDASLSMAAAGGRWRAALDTAAALAGREGTILRFGSGVVEHEPRSNTSPSDGATRLAEALRVARARGGPIVVVTDGEVEDWPAVPPTLLSGVSFVLLVRDTAPDVALLDLDLPRRVARDDSIPLGLLLGTWGALTAQSAQVEIFAGARRVVRREVRLPPPPGIARRSVTLPPGLLDAGDHVLRIRATAAGDREPRDDERLRVITVTEAPEIVAVVAPADWEGRFLVTVLSEVAQAPVRGYVRVTAREWLDMRRLVPVRADTIARAVSAAALVVLRGEAGEELRPGSATPRWRWPAGSQEDAQLLAGDWYVTARLPASPLAGRLAGIAWDSLPPLTGVVPLVPGDGEWVGLTARQGRRGPERPVLVGWDSGGTRALVAGGTGWWRWVLRGGVGREAYRTLVAAGVDWLLAAERAPGGPALTASRAVPRGTPVVFRREGGAIPDTLTVTVVARDTSALHPLVFDAAGMARIELPPGVYRWTSATVEPLRGTTVVEPYSDEFRPRPVVQAAVTPGDTRYAVEHEARSRWWLFGLVILALVGEWAWRRRQGLP